VSDERAKNALEVFEAALAFPEHERSDWVERNCSHDAELAAEVKSLLAAHDKARDFLDLGPTELNSCRVVSNTDGREIFSGQQIGDFLVERQIGAGGMGLVYRARQISLKRSVALKVLPHHLHYSESARARFNREIEAAARLRPCAVQEGSAPPVRQERIYQAFPGWSDELTGVIGRAGFRRRTSRLLGYERCERAGSVRRHGGSDHCGATLSHPQHVPLPGVRG